MARVLVVSDLWLPFPGGAERLMYNLARDLHHRPEHDVLAITGYHQAHVFDGPPVVHADISPDADGWFLIESALVAHQPDVILTHHYYAHQFHDQLVATGLPIVQVVLNGQRMPEAALAVFISQWVAERGDPLADDLVITPPAGDDVIAATHGDAIGFIKPLPHKGVELVYRVARAMPARRFVILRGEWQTLETIRPAPNVTFLEPVVDMRDFYAQVRLLLVPSRSEDAGTVAQEATVNGLACISSNVEGLAETNAGGVQLAPDKPGLWVRAIKALDDPARYAATVARQQAALAAVDHPAQLDQLAQRIEAL